LAEAGEDLSHSLDKRLNKAIQGKFNDDIKAAIRRGAGNATEEIIAMLSMRPPLMEYKELKDTA
jgi:hypothetical protein